MSTKSMLEDYLNSGGEVEVVDNVYNSLLDGKHIVDSIEDDVAGVIKAHVTTEQSSTNEYAYEEDYQVKIKTLDLMYFIYSRQA